MQHLTGQAGDYASDLAFRLVLRDGALLCQILHHLKPGVIPQASTVVNSACDACTHHAMNALPHAVPSSSIQTQDYGDSLLFFCLPCNTAPKLLCCSRSSCWRRYRRYGSRRPERRRTWSAPALS